MSGGGSARKEINMDNKAYQKMDYALCLLSAAADGRRHGCIVNSFHQVTSSFPPKFTVAVNKDHETCKAIQAAGSFSVTLLAEDAPFFHLELTYDGDVLVKAVLDGVSLAL